MNDKTNCPKCDYGFDIKENLKYQVTGVKSFFSIFAYKRSRPLFYNEKERIDTFDESNILICPNCSNEFSTTNYKYFGFLSASSLRILIIIFLLLFMAFPIYIILNSRKIITMLVG